MSHRGPADLKRYAQGIQAMRAAGTYHKYQYWHATFGMIMDGNDPNGIGAPALQRGIAHRGPSFLPWHREFIWRFEQDLNHALGTSNFGLPYWDWATDKSLGELKTSRIWQELGNHTGLVQIGGHDWKRMWAKLVLETVPYSGPTHYEPEDVNFTAFRQFDDDRVKDIPTRSDIHALITNSRPYDSEPWSASSGSSFRNTLERWDGHDYIHMLVGGQNGDHASPFTSVNDPTFFLHHAMVDRIWSKWQDFRLNERGIPLEQQYVPRMGEAPEIHQIGHRIDEPMLPWSFEPEMEKWGLEAENVTPRMVLDHRSPRLNYRYVDYGLPRWLNLVARPLRRWASVEA